MIQASGLEEFVRAIIYWMCTKLQYGLSYDLLQTVLITACCL